VNFPNELFGFTSSLLPSIRASQDLLPELVRRIKPSAVAIETFDSRGEKLRAAAVSSSKSIASSPTVTYSKARIALKSIRQRELFSVKGVLAVDAEGDIALLKIDAPANQIRPLPLDKTSPQEGESVSSSATRSVWKAASRTESFRQCATFPPLDASFRSRRRSLRVERQSGREHAGTGDWHRNVADHRRPECELRDSFGTHFTTSSRADASLGDLVASTGRNKRAKASSFSRWLEFSFQGRLREGAAYFEKAVESDSNYAEAWAQAVSATRNSADMRKRWKLRRRLSV
jgi:hypothetical protein